MVKKGELRFDLCKASVTGHCPKDRSPINGYHLAYACSKCPIGWKELTFWQVIKSWFK